jgi:hypothetical protein
VPRVFSYIVARDFGFAPNPFFGWCTLATCKPEIRRCAKAGDWILGTGSAQHGRAGFAVFTMRAEEDLSFADYWSDPRFLRKRPDLSGSRKLAFGDNIYRCDETGEWKQLNSHHSMHDGSANPLNIATDTRVDRVLVSRDFIYWGGSGPRIPDHLRAFGANEEDLCSLTQGHRCRFGDEMVAATVQWIEEFDQRGLQGRPGQWPQGDGSSA